MKKMNAKRILKNSTKSQQAYESLYKDITHMTPGNNKFPSEEELSSLFGVSRATVRDALVRLRMNRIITSHQGLGTYGHPSVFQLENRIDQDTDFGVMLKKQYKNVTIETSWEYQEHGSNAFQGFFQDTEALRSCWIYSADNLKRLYSRFYFPKELIIQTLDSEIHVESLPEFSQKYMLKGSNEESNYIDYCSMKCHIKFDDEACMKLDIPKGTPLLCFDEVIYNISDRVVGVGEVFVHPDNMVMSLVAPFYS